MPSSPEVGDGSGKEWLLKILAEFNSHDLRDAPGNINATGEVPIDLYTVQQCCDENGDAFVIQVIIKNGIDDDRGTVGDHQLFE